MAGDNPEETTINSGGSAEWGPDEIYNPDFDLKTLPDDKRTAYRRHHLRATISPGMAVFLTIITLGFFALIYYGLMHDELPELKNDDFGAGRAIGFAFIPFFNIYWVFRFWLRLVDRINLQMRLRDYPLTLSKNLMLWTVIISVIPFANFAAVVMYPICVYKLQIAVRQLSGENIPAAGLPSGQADIQAA